MAKTGAQLEREITAALQAGHRPSKPAKTAAQRDRELAAALIAGDAELEGRYDVGKKIRKQEGAAKPGALLGYTASKKPVYAPARARALRVGGVLTKSTKARFPKSWTSDDHRDASRLYKEASEVASVSGNHELADNLEGWSLAHAEMQAAPTEMTKTTRSKVRALLRKVIKDERTYVLELGKTFGEAQGERAAEQAIHIVTKTLGSMLGGVKLAARGGDDTVEIWNQTGAYNAPEFVVDLWTGRVR